MTALAAPKVTALAAPKVTTLAAPKVKMIELINLFTLFINYLNEKIFEFKQIEINNLLEALKAITDGI